MKFPSMPDIIPEGRCGIAHVEHFVIDRHEAAMSSLRPMAYCPEGKYAGLYINGSVVMSDTRIERITNWRAVSESKGHVLIAGLGLGMILLPILEKSEVDSVLVVEKYQDVIDLISPFFPSLKLSIICADIFEWRPSKAQRFNTIYFDIWSDICTDNLEEIAKLHQRFKYYLNRTGKCWMGSWCQDELRTRKRSGE